MMAANAITLTNHTYWDILDLEPCFDPVARGYCARDWTGTALDVLRHPDVPAEEKLWLVFHPGWLPDRILHESAVRFAEQALALVEQPDPRSVAGVTVKRRWLEGKATDHELIAAGAAARAAAATAQGTAWVAAKAAARAAAGDDAAADARAAAWAAAEAAAWVAAEAAPGDAAAAARASARASARDAQVGHLIELIEAASA